MSAERVSVFALARDIRNGGNTSENWQMALSFLQKQEPDPSKFIYRTHLLSPALLLGWRRAGEVNDYSQLDAIILETNPR